MFDIEDTIDALYEQEYDRWFKGAFEAGDEWVEQEPEDDDDYNEYDMSTWTWD